MEDFYKRLNAYRDGLREKYPEVFPQEPVEIAVGPGWWPLLDRLFAAIQEDVKTTGVDVQIVQIKEKFRGLRFYIHGGSDEIRKMVSLAEEVSYRTCEECGKIAEDRNTFERVRTGWLVTLCDDCWKKYEKRTPESG